MGRQPSSSQAEFHRFSRPRARLQAFPRQQLPLPPKWASHLRIIPCSLMTCSFRSCNFPKLQGLSGLRHPCRGPPGANDRERLNGVYPFTLQGVKGGVSRISHCSSSAVRALWSLAAILSNCCASAILDFYRLQPSFFDALSCAARYGAAKKPLLSLSGLVSTDSILCSAIFYPQAGLQQLKETAPSTSNCTQSLPARVPKVFRCFTGHTHTTQHRHDGGWDG